MTHKAVFADLRGIFQKSTANLDIRQGIPTVGEGNYAKRPLPTRPTSTNFDRPRSILGHFRSLEGSKIAAPGPMTPKISLSTHPSGSLRLLGRFGSPPGSRSSKYDADQPASHEESAQIFWSDFSIAPREGVLLHRKSYLIVPFLVL